MKQGVLIYQSKYGATKQYADWIAKATGFAMLETRQADIRQVRQSETVILCGGIYASGIAGLSFLRKNYNQLRDQRIAIFCVGASPFDESALGAIKTHNLKDAFRGIPVFYGRGAWNPEKMTFPDRMLCKLLQKAVAKKDPQTYAPWEEALMSAGENACDWTDPTYIEPLLAWIAEKETL